MSNWDNIEFQKLARVQGGFAFKSDDYQVEGALLVRIGNLQKGSISFQNAVYIDTSINSFSDFKLNNGEILIGLTGDLGKFAKVKKDDLPALLNQRVGRFVLSENTDSEFLYQLISSEYFQEKLKVYFEGGAQANISPKQIESVYVYTTTSKSEQTRIAQILSTADRAIAQTEALIAKYQRIKTGLMQDLLTKGIDEHGNIRSEQTHRFKTEKGLRVPEEWEVGTISDIALINPKTDILNLSANDFVSFLKMEDVSNDAQIINKNERQLKDVLSGFTNFQEGDTLFAKITPCMENGKGGLVKDLKNGIGFGSTEFHVLRPKNIKSELFLYYYSTFKQFRLKAEAQMTGSAGQKRVQRFFFENHLIGIPSLDEQFTIGKKIEAISVFLKVETKNLKKLQSLKTGLMQDLLSGKVRVKMSEPMINTD